MKKLLLSLIALFVMGEMCSAETLSTGQTLDTGQRVSQSSSTRAQKISRRASEFVDPETATTYFVVSSCYDITGKFGTDTRNYSGYVLNMDMPADGKSGEVTITGICNFTEYEDVKPIPVKGEYDAEAHTVTIPTPFDSNSANRCIKAATYVRGGYDFTATLAGCQVADKPDMTGQYPINVLDELVFDVAEDGTLTPRTSWLIYTFGGIGNGIENLYNVTIGKTITDGPNVFTVPAEVVFPDETVFAGAKSTENLFVVNAGRKAASIDYDIHGTGLQLAAAKTIAKLSFNNFFVYLTAENEGEFNGSIEVKPEGGKTISIPVKANVMKGNDYNSIVKNGSFTFSLTESEVGGQTYESWVIDEKITGHPVAVATLKDMGSCGLDVNMEVPVGQVGVFSWKGISQTQSPNGFRVILDNSDIIYNTQYQWNGYTAAHPADGYITVPEGKHTVTFEYVLEMDWYSMGITDIPQIAYIWDLDLQTFDKKDELGLLMNETVDFGTWYLDKFIGGATAEASILNIGDKTLTVTGGENSESFEVVGIGREVESMETLKSLISFTGDREGDYDEVVTVKTNGGDFKVRCVAKAEKIINDYQYLVSEGDLSFGTSTNHPFTADRENGIAFSSTAKLEATSTDADPDSWLSASFIIPEGNEGTIYWTADNNSNELFEFAGEATFTDGTQLFIDGELIQEFAGICEATSKDVDDSYLKFGPGRHCVKFNYVRMSSTSSGNDDRVVIRDIGLKVAKSSVESVNGNHYPESEEYFTLDGRRVAKPLDGIYIKKSLYSDGSVKASKVVVR